MKTPQRILLYSFGFLIGAVMVYFMLIRGNDRTYWLPENRVKELILKSKMIYSPISKCEMECLSISEDDVLSILKNGEVNFKESNVHAVPHPSYSINGTITGNRKMRMMIVTHDSIAEITTVAFQDVKKTCICK